MTTSIPIGSYAASDHARDGDDSAQALLEQLVAAATLAPSGDNTQPWRFTIDAPRSRIAIGVDEARDLSPMNAGQRMARIAVGAAVENLVRTAVRSGLGVRVSKGGGAEFVSVDVHRRNSAEVGVEPALCARVTNRRIYDGRTITNDVAQNIKNAASPLEGVTTHWILDRPTQDRFARLISRADAIMFGEAAMREAFLAKIRFDAMDGEEVDEGLSLGALELPPGGRMALAGVQRMPHWCFRALGLRHCFGMHARRLVRSASGLCLGVAPDSDYWTDVVVGRAMEQAWLTLARHDLAVQPMMSLLVLQNVAEQQDRATVERIGAAALQRLLDDFNALVAQSGCGRPAFLMRFGYAGGPTGRTGRRPARIDQPVSTRN